MVNSKLTFLVLTSSAFAAVVPREDPEAGHESTTNQRLPPSAFWGRQGPPPTNAENHFPGSSVGDYEHGDSEFISQPELSMSAYLKAAATGAPGAGPFPEKQQYDPTSVPYTSISQPNPDGQVPPFWSEAPVPHIENSFQKVHMSSHEHPIPVTSRIRPPPRASDQPIRPVFTFTQIPRPHTSNEASLKGHPDVQDGGPSLFGIYGQPPGSPHGTATVPAEPDPDTQLKDSSSNYGGPDTKYTHAAYPDPVQGGSSEFLSTPVLDGELPNSPHYKSPPGASEEAPHLPQPEEQGPHPGGQSPHSYSGPPRPSQLGIGEFPRPTGPDWQPPHLILDDSLAVPPYPLQPQEEQPHPEGGPSHTGDGASSSQTGAGAAPQQVASETYGGLPNPLPSSSAGAAVYPLQPQESQPNSGHWDGGHFTNSDGQQGGSPALPCPCSLEHGRAPFDKEASVYHPAPKEYSYRPIDEPSGGYDQHPVRPQAMQEGENPFSKDHQKPSYDYHPVPPVLGLESSGKWEAAPGITSSGKSRTWSMEQSHISSAAVSSRSPVPSQPSVPTQSPPRPTHKTTDVPSPNLHSSAQVSSDAVMRKSVSTSLASVVAGLLLIPFIL